MNKTLLFFLILINTVILQSQNNILRGLVYDKGTSFPLPGANISLEPGLSKYINSTDSDGMFLFTGLPDGKFIFRITYIGYKTYADTIVFNKNNKEIIKDIYLVGMFPPPINYVDTTISGKYQSSFEYSGIIPCNSNEHFWVDKAPEIFWEKYESLFINLEGLPCKYNNCEVYIRAKCKLSEPGRYGHLSGYNYQIIIEELLEMKLWKPEYCE